MRFVPVCIIPLFLSACSNHPLVDDVTINSYQVMQKIRCETVTALEAIILEQLNSGGQSLKEIASRVEADRLHLSQIETSELPKDLRRAWEAYKNTVLAFAFTFFAQEDNGANGEVKLSFPFTDGTVGLTLGTQNSLRRIGERKFTIAETVDELSDNKTCANDQSDEEKNFVYPISGNIGMYEVLNSFFNISNSVSTVHEYTDRISFTTNISGSVSPSIELSRADLTNASATVSAGRIDTHQLLFTVNLGEEGRRFQVFEDLPAGRVVQNVPATTTEMKARAMQTLRREQYLINNDELKNIILSSP